MKLFGDQKKQDENVNSKDLSAMSLSDDELADVSGGGSVVAGATSSYDQMILGNPTKEAGYVSESAFGNRNQRWIDNNRITQEEEEERRKQAEKQAEREFLKLGFTQLWAWIKYRRGL